MPSGTDLLAVARHLLGATPDGLVADAFLRRAVSTAYYAAFHTVLEAAARRFIGVPTGSDTPAYVLIYRSFDHRRMKTVCDNLRKTTLAGAYGFVLGRVSSDARIFAAMFVDLQEMRHFADYDPIAEFSVSDVADIIASADEAIAAFNRITDTERSSIIALLMVGVRT